MSKEPSLYPVSQQIAKIIRGSGYTPLGFLLNTGHADADSLLPGLESWLENGEGDEAVIAMVAAYDPDAAAALHESVKETAAMKAAGVDPVAFEEARKERLKRESFQPYIHVQGERRVPSPITIFAVTGGHERWSTIRIPPAVLELPLDEQFAQLRALMAGYLLDNNGTTQFFGKVVGFKFVRYSDYFEFDVDGQLTAQVPAPFRPGIAWVEL